MIRHATHNDILDLIAMTKAFHKESTFNQLEFSVNKVAAQLNSMIGSLPDNLVLVLEKDNKLIGALVGISISPILTEEKTATELMWWVEPEHRSTGEGLELLDAYEYWAELIGCKLISMSCFDDRLGKFYENQGYVLNERSYIKWSQ